MMKKIKSCLCRESVSGVIFSLPFIIGLVLFLIVPLGISLYYAFCEYNIRFHRTETATEPPMIDGR